jgi:hypothetical protein
MKLGEPPNCVYDAPDGNIPMKLLHLLLLMLLLLPFAGHAQFTCTTNDGAVTITGYTGSGGSVVIPNIFNGYPVANIGNWAFYSTSITNVLISDSVTNIGDGAFFDCESLTNVTLGNSVTNVGDWAFGFCPSLSSICCRGNAFRLGGDSVFYGNLASIFYLPGATKWGPTFDGHPAILWNPPIPFTYGTNSDGITLTITKYNGSSDEMTIPSSINFLPVTIIGNYAFYHLIDLITVTIPNSVTNIGEAAFCDCWDLTSITIPDGVASVEPYTFSGCSGMISVSIPHSVISIGYQSFLDCASLTNIIIPNAVTSIGNESFSDCVELTSVAIPDNVTNIGDGAFNDCSSLTAITVSSSNAFYMSVDGVLFNQNGTLLIQFPGGKSGNYLIPNNVTGIGDYAFAWSHNLSALTIPKSMVMIDSTAFIDCTNLVAIAVDPESPFFCGVDGVLFNQGKTSLIQYPGGKVGSYVIPDGVTNIGDFAFCNCIGLTGVMIPDSVVSLGYESFAQCSGLTSVVIPGSVTSFGGYTFYDCASLNGIYLEGSAPAFVDGSWNFFDSGGVTVYYVPGTTFLGWQPGYAWPPTAPWLPEAQTDDSLGVKNNQFGFNINWASGQTVVVEACTNLANPKWQPVQTNTLMTGSTYFSDPQWTNYSKRFYRLRSQ